MEFNKLKKQLGIKIKKLRKSRGLTQEQLSEKLRIDYRHLSGIETGQNTPSLKLLLSISNQFEIKIIEIFDFDNVVCQSPELKNLIKAAIDLKIAK